MYNEISTSHFAQKAGRIKYIIRKGSGYDQMIIYHAERSQD